MSTTPNTSPLNLAFQLASDANFLNRVRSCLWQQSQTTYQSSTDEASANMANDILRGGAVTIQPMVNMIAAFPGLAEGVTLTLGDGTQIIDQTAVKDGDILAQVQANWKTVADLFYPAPPPVPT